MLAGELADKGKVEKASPWQRACSTTLRRTTAKFGWRSAQMDTRLHRWKDAEDALNKADAADHQERRPVSIFSFSWRAG